MTKLPKVTYLVPVMEALQRKKIIHQNGIRKLIFPIYWFIWSKVHWYSMRWNKMSYHITSDLYLCLAKSQGILGNLTSLNNRFIPCIKISNLLKYLIKGSLIFIALKQYIILNLNIFKTCQLNNSSLKIKIYWQVDR